MVFFAQGFGLGRIPLAPGTFGSVLGLLWFWLLLVPGQPSVLVAGTVAGLAMAVWLSGAAEKILGKKDPPSVIVDEIAAIPVCFLSWTGLWVWRTGALPQAGELVARNNWPAVLGVFVAFRFFDVLKPWPVRQSQALPGGWGITVDDFLAAIYVSLLVLLVHLARIMFSAG